jgi:protein FAM50
MEAKFSAHYDAVEVELKSSTVGLLTIEQMKNRQEEAIKEREMQLARKNREELNSLRREEEKRNRAKLKQKQQIKALSFNPDCEEEEEEEEPEIEVKKPEKKVSVNHFLFWRQSYGCESQCQRGKNLQLHQ